MKTLTKTLVATAAAGAMAVSAASPAAARDRGNGIDAGDVIAGALVIGGIAAIVAAASDNDHGDRYDSSYRYDRAGYGGYSNARYGYGDPNPAAQQCVYAAEQNANRVSWGGRADVTDIRSVRQTRNGYEVKGRIAVNAMGHGWQRGNANYGSGWNGDYRGWNSNLRGYDSGTFTCKVRGGRIADIDYNGIRGL
jgi:hypothetical protein